jgi:TatD DNase family protein
MDRLILETDAPYLPPVPYRGKRNESSYVRYVAEHLAKIKNITFEEVAQTTTQNALKLFSQIV